MKCAHLIAMACMLLASQFASAEPEGQKGFQAYLSYKVTDALRYYLSGIRKARSTDNVELVARYSLNIAHIYLEAGNHQKAHGFNQEGLKIYLSLNNKEGIAYAIVQRGKYYCQKGNGDSARALISAGHSRFKAMKLKKGAGMALNELAVLEIAEKNIPAAKSLLIDLLKTNKKTALGAAIANNLGKAFLLEGHYREAERYLIQALELDNEFTSYAGRSITLINLAKTMSAQNKCNEAEFYLDRARSLGYPGSLKTEIEEIESICSVN